MKQKKTLQQLLFCTLYLQTTYHMTQLQLFSLLIGILGLHWVLQRFVAKPLLELGAAVMYLLTIVLLLSMGGLQHHGAGIQMVLVMCAVATCRHGWRYFYANSSR